MSNKSPGVVSVLMPNNLLHEQGIHASTHASNYQVKSKQCSRHIGDQKILVGVLQGPLP